MSNYEKDTLQILLQENQIRAFDWDVVSPQDPNPNVRDNTSGAAMSESFDDYVARMNIMPEELGPAFAAWMNLQFGWDGKVEVME